jgi:hypothetical protein
VRLGAGAVARTATEACPNQRVALPAALWCGLPAGPLAGAGALCAVGGVGLRGPCGRWPPHPTRL